MVLTQLKCGPCGLDDQHSTFPYHYGSYATHGSLLCSEIRALVSIPLWFLRNHDTRRNLPLDIPGFHTTMVLTQRRAAQLMAEVIDQVSIPLWFLRNGFSEGDEIRFKYVSIPLWFLRNACRGHREGRLRTFPYHYGSYATLT